MKIFCLSLLIPLCTNLRADETIKNPDYVIVGVGTAGAVLAKKLSDDKKTKVVALHRGENLSDTRLIKLSKNAIFTVLAALFGSGDTPTDMTTIDEQVAQLKALTQEAGVPFLYETGNSTPQPEAFNQELLWVIPLPLGGGSSINAGAWCRQTNQVNRQWEAIAGPNWSVKRITEVYKELEDYDGRTTNRAARGFHGPIHVRQVPPSKLSQKFARAIVEATGFSRVLDYNDPKTPIGVSPRVQITEDGVNGRLRVSSATAFLNEDVMTPDGFGVNGRKLRVLFDSFGLRTIWDGKKAVGVEYIQDGEVKEIRAKKGVIVCCGLRSSPFLLHSLSSTLGS